METVIFALATFGLTPTVKIEGQPDQTFSQPEDSITYVAGLFPNSHPGYDIENKRANIIDNTTGANLGHIQFA